MNGRAIFIWPELASLILAHLVFAPPPATLLFALDYHAKSSGSSMASKHWITGWSVSGAGGIAVHPRPCQIQSPPSSRGHVWLCAGTFWLKTGPCLPSKLPVGDIWWKLGWRFRGGQLLNTARSRASAARRRPDYAPYSAAIKHKSGKRRSVISSLDRLTTFTCAALRLELIID